MSLTTQEMRAELIKDAYGRRFARIPDVGLGLVIGIALVVCTFGFIPWWVIIVTTVFGALVSLSEKAWEASMERSTYRKNITRLLDQIDRGLEPDRGRMYSLNDRDYWKIKEYREAWLNEHPGEELKDR